MFAKSVCMKLIGRGLLPEDFLRQLPRYPNFLEGALSWGVSYEALTGLLLDEYGIESRRVQDGEVSAAFMSGLHPDMKRLMEKHTVLPVSVLEDRLFLIMADPFDYVAADDVCLATGYKIERLFAEPQAVRRQIGLMFGEGPDAPGRAGPGTAGERRAGDRPRPVGLRADVQDAPAVRLLDDIIETAIRRSASDIHIEPFGSSLRVRHRLDGSLVLYKEVDMSEHPGLMVRLKVISGLDAAEKRGPQDGHIVSGVYSDKVDFRVGIMPTVHGEKAVIRIIYRKHSGVDKHSLGFFPDDMPRIARMFDPSPGAVIVTGPTGSGKTTTLAAFMNGLNTMDVNAVSIEDPVENDIHGINQININPRIGMDFASCLRSVLRQDPDIIMIGEIRDPETANIAMRAALTGHLVLTTLHTNDAVGSIARLTDMGVPGYIVSAVLKGVISQRLMRRLCPECRRPAVIPPEDARALGIPEGSEVYTAAGCDLCNGTGYSGRFAVYEYIIADAELRELIHNSANADRIRACLEQRGAQSILRNALKNVLMGNSTVAELYRTVYHV